MTAMTNSRYIRMRLEATALQRVDPAGLVEDWLEDLRDLLEGVQSDEPQQEAYSLLAMYGRLRRVRPELLAVDREGLAARLEAEIHAHRDDLIAEALGVPNPPAWLDLAQALADSYDDFMDPAEQTQAAWRLVQDWDDAAIVRALAGEQWAQEPGLEEEWQQAQDWLLAHADTFLAASFYVQTVAATFRDDLETHAPELAPTTQSFVALLDACEVFEVESRYEHLEPLTPEQVKACLPERPTVTVARAANWLLRSHAPALAAQEMRVREHVSCTWRSPDERYLAMLVVPLDLALVPGSRLTITFHRNDDALTAAAELTGSPVQLDGVPVLIDAAGTAVFDASLVVERAGDSPELQVGDPPEAWSICER